MFFHEAGPAFCEGLLYGDHERIRPLAGRFELRRVTDRSAMDRAPNQHSFPQTKGVREHIFKQGCPNPNPKTGWQATSASGWAGMHALPEREMEMERETSRLGHGRNGGRGRFSGKDIYGDQRPFKYTYIVDRTHTLR